MAGLELEARVLRRVGDPLRVVAVELRERGAAERARDGDEVVHDRDHVELAGHRVDVVPRRGLRIAHPVADAQALRARRRRSRGPRTPSAGRPPAPRSSGTPSRRGRRSPACRSPGSARSPPGRSRSACTRRRGSEARRSWQSATGPSSSNPNGSPSPGSTRASGASTRRSGSSRGSQRSARAPRRGPRHRLRIRREPRPPAAAGGAGHGLGGGLGLGRRRRRRLGLGRLGRSRLRRRRCRRAASTRSPAPRFSGGLSHRLELGPQHCRRVGPSAGGHAPGARRPVDPTVPRPRSSFRISLIACRPSGEKRTFSSSVPSTH